MFSLKRTLKEIVGRDLTKDRSFKDKNKTELTEQKASFGHLLNDMSSISKETLKVF